jgi:hypothetical protein
MGSFGGIFFLEDKGLRALNLHVSVSASNLSHQSQKLEFHLWYAEAERYCKCSTIPHMTTYYARRLYFGWKSTYHQCIYTFPNFELVSWSPSCTLPCIVQIVIPFEIDTLWCNLSASMSISDSHEFGLQLLPSQADLCTVCVANFVERVNVSDAG